MWNKKNSPLSNEPAYPGYDYPSDYPSAEDPSSHPHNHNDLPYHSATAYYEQGAQFAAEFPTEFPTEHYEPPLYPEFSTPIEPHKKSLFSVYLWGIAAAIVVLVAGITIFIVTISTRSSNTVESTNKHPFTCSANDQSMYSTVKEYLDRGANVDAHDDDAGLDRTRLMIASAESNPCTVQLLLEHHAAVNAKNNQGETALDYAAEKNNTDIILLLLNHGANVNTTTNHGPTCRGICKGETPLDYAVDAAMLNNVRILLDHHANPNHPDASGSTALHKAIVNNNIDIVRLLIEHGANINAQRSTGETPLYLATINSSLPMMHLLLDHGANVNIKDKDGNTPLIISVQSSKDVVTLLLDHGANINAKNNFGLTALDQAKMINAPDIITLLRSRGAR